MIAYVCLCFAKARLAPPAADRPENAVSLCFTFTFAMLCYARLCYAMLCCALLCFALLALTSVQSFCARVYGSYGSRRRRTRECRKLSISRTQENLMLSQVRTQSVCVCVCVLVPGTLGFGFHFFACCTPGVCVFGLPQGALNLRQKESRREEEKKTTKGDGKTTNGDEKRRRDEKTRRGHERRRREETETRRDSKRRRKETRGHCVCVCARVFLFVHVIMIRACMYAHVCARTYTCWSCTSRSHLFQCFPKQT